MSKKARRITLSLEFDLPAPVDVRRFTEAVVRAMYFLGIPGGTCDASVTTYEPELPSAKELN